MKSIVSVILALALITDVQFLECALSSDITTKGLESRETVQNALDDLIIEILNGFKAGMSEGFPGLGIPPLDPLAIPAIPLDIQEPLLKVKGDLSDIHVDGLSSFEVTSVKSNLILLSLEFGLELPSFSINGNYDIDGLAALIFPIYGKGPFSITVSGVQFTAGSKLGIIFGGFKVKDLQYNLTLNGIDVKFENLLGGGEFGDVINDIITSLGVQVFNMIEPLIHDTMVDAITAILNYALGPKRIADHPALASFSKNAIISTNFQNIPNADAGAYVDQVLANLRHQMIMNGLDRIDLPDSTIEFSQVVLGIRWNGIASLYSGVARGIETLHRSGDSNLVLEPNGDIVFDAELEVNDVTIFSELLVKFMGLGPEATVSGSLKRVSVEIKCRVAAGFSAVSLEVLNVKNLGYLSIDVKGLGLFLNFVAELVVESFGNLVKGIVANILEVPVKNLLNTIISETAFTSTSSSFIVPSVML